MSSVIDPGHGGSQIAGRSTPYGAISGALVEADLVLAIAQRIRARSREVFLTREGNTNPTLSERSAVSRYRSAASFISLHANASHDPSKRGAELYVHPAGSAHSRSFAEELARSLRQTGLPVSGVYRQPMAILDPALHPPHTAACLVELGYLSNEHDRALLGSPEGQERIAEAIIAPIEPGRVVVETKRESFDIWHEVPLVEQLTGMSCWAAAAAMIVGWRECIDVNADEVAKASGRWHWYRDGLEPRDVEELARVFELVAEPPRRYTVAELRRLLDDYGPLWVGEASPGLHVVVIAGLYGDGTLDGTFVRVADPWPVGKGERYTISFRELAKRLTDVEAIAGVQAQIIHSTGRACGARRKFYSWRSSRLSLEGTGGESEEFLSPFIH